ncbi:MAG: ribosomal L7Ae/L30e/S12e/Gadd45 family protein [Nanoarchaeota archaeon]|nr:ribosomal L7Ae/L30e/S12e/Gadd45 family protein [Nanoarchaeota archaeon]
MSELSDALKGKKLVFGTDRTLKLLRNDKIEKVFVSKNCNESIKKDIEHYAKLNKVKVIELDITNDEVGAFCKKPFSVSVLSLEK